MAGKVDRYPVRLPVIQCGKDTLTRCHRGSPINELVRTLYRAREAGNSKCSRCVKSARVFARTDSAVWSIRNPRTFPDLHTVFETLFKRLEI